MVKKPEVRQKILDAARELFWKNGYEATGIAEILKKAEVGSGSLYWFFRTKEDLLAEVLKEYIRLLYPNVAEPAFRQSEDPVERVFIICDRYREILLTYGFKLGCPVGRIVLELGDRYENIRKLTDELLFLWREMIKKCLLEASDRFCPGTDFEEVSVFIFTTLQGAMLQARAHKNIRYFDISISQMRVYLESRMINQSEKSL